MRSLGLAAFLSILPGTAPALTVEDEPDAAGPGAIQSAPLEPLRSDGDAPAVRIAPRGEAAGEGEASEPPAPDEQDAVEAELSPEEPALTPQADLDALPEPVRRMRRLLIEAASAGDLAAVARLAGTGENMTELSLAPEGEDAETLLREQSGDEEGYEVLAILLEILEAPYVVIDEGTDEALYLWPWFAGVPLDTLTPAEQVAVYRLMTAGDFQQSLEFGTYVFFRTGIAADGTWAFFVAGD